LQYAGDCYVHRGIANCKRGKFRTLFHWKGEIESVEPNNPNNHNRFAKISQETTSILETLERGKIREDVVLQFHTPSSDFFNVGGSLTQYEFCGHEGNKSSSPFFVPHTSLFKTAHVSIFYK